MFVLFHFVVVAVCYDGYRVDVLCEFVMCKSDDQCYMFINAEYVDISDDTFNIIIWRVVLLLLFVVVHV